MKKKTYLLLLAILLSWSPSGYGAGQAEGLNPILYLLLSGESGPCYSGPQTVEYGANMWQRCDNGKNYNYASAETYCQGLAIGGYSDWRLPTKDELKSIVYCSNGHPVPLNDGIHGCGYDGYDAPYERPLIDPALFSCTAGSYWTSSTIYDDGVKVLYVDFYYGFTLSTSKDVENFYVRCIR